MFSEEQVKLQNFTWHLFYAMMQQQFKYNVYWTASYILYLSNDEKKRESEMEIKQKYCLENSEDMVRKLLAICEI